MGAMRVRLLTAISLVTIATACTSAPRTSASTSFHTQLDADWKYWMTQYPEMATSVGYPGQDTRWTDYSASAIDARAAYLKQSLTQVAKIDRAGLDAADQVNYDLYKDLIETAVTGLDFHNDAVPIRGVIPHNLLMPMNQLEGVQQDIPNTIAVMPVATRDDYDHIVSRLQGVPALVDQTIALLEQGLAAKVTPPKITLRDVPDQVTAQIVADPHVRVILARAANLHRAGHGPIGQHVDDPDLGLFGFR